MTTIAVRIGKDYAEMAADSRACGASILQHPIQKIRAYDDCLVGYAGGLSDAMGFIHWLESGGEPDEWPDKGLDVVALMVYRSGKSLKCICYEGGPHPYEVGKVAAIGSGGDYAMVAMKFGATPKEAVRVAKEYDPYTGGPVRTKRIEL